VIGLKFKLFFNRIIIFTKGRILYFEQNLNLMDRRKRYIQSRLECYLTNKIQQILPENESGCKKNPYKEIKCSLVSEIIISDSYSYFRCEYRESIEYPKTGLCLSCPLRDFPGIWIGADVDQEERREYLKSQINRQWLCFGIK